MHYRKIMHECECTVTNAKIDLLYSSIPETEDTIMTLHYMHDDS